MTLRTNLYCTAQRWDRMEIDAISAHLKAELDTQVLRDKAGQAARHALQASDRRAEAIFDLLTTYLPVVQDGDFRLLALRHIEAKGDTQTNRRVLSRLFQGPLQHPCWQDGSLTPEGLLVNRIMNRHKDTALPAVLMISAAAPDDVVYPVAQANGLTGRILAHQAERRPAFLGLLHEVLQEGIPWNNEGSGFVLSQGLLDPAYGSAEDVRALLRKARQMPESFIKTVLDGGDQAMLTILMEKSEILSPEVTKAVYRATMNKADKKHVIESFLGNHHFTIRQKHAWWNWLLADHDLANLFSRETELELWRLMLQQVVEPALEGKQGTDEDRIQLLFDLEHWVAKAAPIDQTEMDRLKSMLYSIDSPSIFAAGLQLLKDHRLDKVDLGALTRNPVSHQPQNARQLWAIVQQNFLEPMCDPSFLELARSLVRVRRDYARFPPPGSPTRLLRQTPWYTKQGAMQTRPVRSWRRQAAHYPRRISSTELLGMVRELHHRTEDFEEGDLPDRILAHDVYELRSIPLSRLDLDEFTVHPAYVDDIKSEMRSKKSHPPIVVGSDCGIIDGIHRANALRELGQTSVLAYQPAAD
jgi:hypothetical protein